MKKIISLIILFVVLGFFATAIFSSDVKLILRALHQPKETNWQTMMMPSWLADLKLKTLGVSDCKLSFTEKADTGPVIIFLVSAYGGEGVDNNRVKAYISRFVKQGCNVDEYDMGGMTPLHGAILFAQPEVVQLLLENNADVTKKINRPNKRVDGMRPLEFAKFLLASNDTQELRNIIVILQDSK